MNITVRVLLATAGLSLMSAYPAFALEPPVTNAIVALSRARTGQWIKLEGIPEKDSSLRCTKFKLLFGDRSDSNWTLRGSLLPVEPGSSEFRIGMFLIRLASNPKYRGGRDTLKGFEDLKAGMIVKVKGQYLGDGMFLARKVDNESERLATKPGIDTKIRILGKIERVDASRHSITVMGTTFQVTDKTQVRSGSAAADSTSD
ncbi:MAG TPA: DUF5666 domain-containing protein [Gemmatimonadales bacterium]|jgi:hypothetical protein|nr:DUF5666 domain-containing protein [Gemmatimonadales bacterium]